MVCLISLEQSVLSYKYNMSCFTQDALNMKHVIWNQHAMSLPVSQCSEYWTHQCSEDHGFQFISDQDFCLFSMLKKVN